MIEEMAAKQNQYHPEIVFHPGETLSEVLDEWGMGPKEFSIRTNKPEKTIIAILKGDSSITPEMAVVFEHVLKVPAHLWLSLQSAYNEYVARVENLSSVEKAIEWTKLFPVKDMVRLGWLKRTSTWFDKTSELFSFFGVSNPTAWQDYYCNQKLKVAFRISLYHTQQPYAISAWLRHGEICAKRISANIYSEPQLRALLPKIKDLMINHNSDLFSNLQDLCLSVGVKLIYTPCLPKAPISGSTRWLGNNPVIQLSGRYKRNDIFWFTFFHEIGHILLHGKKEIFLEGSDHLDDIEEAGAIEEIKKKEIEADEFAVKHTFSHEDLKCFIDNYTITEESIVSFAKKIHTHPALIIGRLQHEKKIKHNIGVRFLEQVEFGDSRLV